jgi:predicted ribosome quality control (RQC) complex YloA/Tae2 family protein
VGYIGLKGSTVALNEGLRAVADERDEFRAAQKRAQKKKQNAAALADERELEFLRAQQPTLKAECMARNPSWFSGEAA